MQKGRKQYDQVFKERAIGLMQEQTNISQLSKELEVKVLIMRGYNVQKELEQNEGSYLRWKLSGFILQVVNGMEVQGLQQN